MSDAGNAEGSAGDGERIEVVLFDIGGVLARFAGLESLRELTHATSETEVAARWLHSPWVRRFEAGACDERTFAAGVVDEWQLPYTPEEFLDVFPTWLDEPFDGAEQLLRETAARRSVGCLSNTNALQWRTVISRWPLCSLFEHRLMSFELGAVKPDLELYQLALARLPVGADRVLFLDDNRLNVEGARAAGLRAEQALGVAQARGVLERHGLLD